MASLQSDSAVPPYIPRLRTADTKSRYGGRFAMPNYDLIGQGVGAFFLVMASAYALVNGHRKSDGKAPDDRPPTPHEVRQAIVSLQSQVERAAMDEAVAVELLRAVKSLISALDKMTVALNDNTEMSDDMRSDIRDMARDLRSLVVELIRHNGRHP